MSVFVCNNYLFVFGLAGRLFVPIREANWGGKTLFVSTRLACSMLSNSNQIATVKPITGLKCDVTNVMAAVWLGGNN